MFVMKDNQVKPARVKVSSSPSYTLPEIEQLAHEFADDGERSDGGKVHVQATML